LTQNYYFNVEVKPNNPPSISGLADQTVAAGSSASYTLPTITEPED
jgi:hypothetical protein